MSDRLRFHLDEHVPYAVATALRRRGIDVTTTPEAGLRQADDLAHLTFAHQEVEHAGIAYCKKGTRSIGEIIGTLRLMVELMTPEEMSNRVEYL